ncbi:hypothetical protein KR038_001893, partial [Drosophila bunnanda]
YVRAEFSGYHIYSCHLAPSLMLEAFFRIPEDLSCDLRRRANVIVGSDFNAWDQEWGSFSTNVRGRAVLAAFAATDVLLDEISDAYTRSDQEAILCSVGVPEADMRSLMRPTKAYRPDTLCTQAFANALKGMAVGAPGGDNETPNRIAAALEHACDQSMRLKGSIRSNHTPVFRWNDKVADLR